MTAETTTIEITTEQKAELNRMGFGSYKAALQELIETHKDTSGLTESRVRELAREEIRDGVVYEALE